MKLKAKISYFLRNEIKNKQYQEKIQFTIKKNTIHNIHFM